MTEMGRRLLSAAKNARTSLALNAVREENIRLRAALEAILEVSVPGSHPWAVIPDHLSGKARAALAVIDDGTK